MAEPLWPALGEPPWGTAILSGWMSSSEHVLPGRAPSACVSIQQLPAGVVAGCLNTKRALIT